MMFNILNDKNYTGTVQTYKSATNVNIKFMVN